MQIQNIERKEVGIALFDGNRLDYEGDAQLYSLLIRTGKPLPISPAVKSQLPGVAVTFLELDLSSFESIKSSAKTVLASSPRLDIPMLNIGRKQLHPEMEDFALEF